MSLPKIYDWEKIRAALQLLEQQFPDLFPLWQLVGGGACWFYRRSLELAQDPDFRSPPLTPEQEYVWLSKDVDFMGISREEAAQLFGAPVKPETRTITFAGLEVDFVEQGLHMTERESADSARLVQATGFDFYVADAALLYDEKVALVATKSRPQDILHRDLLAEFLKLEFCRDAEHPEQLDTRDWLKRAQVVKTANFNFFSDDPRLPRRLASAIRALTRHEHRALKHWARHNLPGYTE